MDSWTYYAITHRDHRLLNPLSPGKIDELIALLRLEASARVLDIACGKGELLLRVAARHDVQAVGVDLSPHNVRDARVEIERRDLAGRVELLEADAAHYEAPPESFDVVLCLGASWIWDGLRGTLRALARWTRPGGTVVSGEPHWLAEPSPELLAVEGVEATTFSSHAGNVDIGRQEGLVPLYALTSNLDEWDRYQALQWQAGERWAEANPDHPDRAALLARLHTERDTYLRWGRDTLGFGLYVFRKPAS